MALGRGTCAVLLVLAGTTQSLGFRVRLHMWKELPGTGSPPQLLQSAMQPASAEQPAEAAPGAASSIHERLTERLPTVILTSMGALLHQAGAQAATLRARVHAKISNKSTVLIVTVGMLVLLLALGAVSLLRAMVRRQPQLNPNRHTPDKDNQMTFCTLHQLKKEVDKAKKNLKGSVKAPRKKVIISGSESSGMTQGVAESDSNFTSSFSLHAAKQEVPVIVAPSVESTGSGGKKVSARGIFDRGSAQRSASSGLGGGSTGEGGVVKKMSTLQVAGRDQKQRSSQSPQGR